MLIEIMHTVTTALQVPVVLLLMIMAVFMVVVLGMLVAEFFTERRYFKLSVPNLVDQLQHSNDAEAVVRESGMLRRQKMALFELLHHPDATPSERESMAVNIVAQEQAVFDNRVKVTDFVSKVAPMLGLMGTLIPLGPGIIAIGAGDTQTLSDSLLVAFDTTVTGLIVASVALLVSTIRKSWYAKYSAAFEAACEIVLEKANEDMEAAPAEAVEAPLPATVVEALPSQPVAGSATMPATGIPQMPAADGSPMPAASISPIPTANVSSMPATDISPTPAADVPSTPTAGFSSKPAWPGEMSWQQDPCVPPLPEDSPPSNERGVRGNGHGSNSGTAFAEGGDHD